jgi:hypothetical protein
MEKQRNRQVNINMPSISLPPSDAQCRTHEKRQRVCGIYCLCLPAENLAGVVEQIHLVILHLVRLKLIHHSCIVLVLHHKHRIGVAGSIAHLLLHPATQQSSLRGHARSLHICQSLRDWDDPDSIPCCYWACALNPRCAKDEEEYGKGHENYAIHFFVIEYAPPAGGCHGGPQGLAYARTVGPTRLPGHVQPEGVAEEPQEWASPVQTWFPRTKAEICKDHVCAEQ